MTLTDQIRNELKHASVSTYRISKDTGVPMSSLSRFKRGMAGLSNDALDRVSDRLGLRVCKDHKQS